MADNIVTKGIRSFLTNFMNWLPENANRQTAFDQGNVSKTSPTLFDYDVFRINWEKVTTLREIDEMLRADPRMKRANHVFASTAVRRGLTIKVTSGMSEALAQRGQEIIDDMMRRTQLNSKLAPWTRSMLKDGELFLNPVIDFQLKLITDIKNLPAITMQRNENIKGRFDDPEKDAFRQIDPISRMVITSMPLWSVNHIRHDHESGQLYGNSQYLACRAVWRKLTMTEEDLVVRRRTRAIPRRLHKVGNDKSPGSWDEIKRYKQENGLNDPKRNTVTTDYYGNGLTDIKDLNGDAQLDHIKDIEHLQELLMIGTGVPLHLLGFGKNVNRDIVEDQKKQFDEDVLEVRDLLENGDESPYSGLRAMFDLQLMMQGVDPALVDYNFMWSETANETIDNKVDRVIKLRASQPSPLLSAKTALAYLGRDLNLENQEAVDSELQAIEEERQADIEAEQAAAAAINPIKPTTTPADRTTMQASGKPTADSVEIQAIAEAILDAIQKPKHPLRQKKVVDLEKSLADDVHSFFKAVKKRMEDSGIEAKIAKVQKLKLHFDSIEPMSEDARTLLTPHGRCNCSECSQVITDADDNNVNDLIEQHVIDEFNQAWQSQNDDENGSASFHNTLIDAYTAAARFAFDNVDAELKNAAEHPAGVSVSTNFIHSGVVDDLKQEAGTRIKGIENTTRQLLRDQMAQAYRNGESLAEWMDRIDSVMDIPEWRSSMIARTELSWAYNQANTVAYKQAGVHRVQWLSVLDNRTCSVCRDRNGVEYSITELPELPAHPRCRCTTTAVL